MNSYINRIKKLYQVIYGDNNMRTTIVLFLCLSVISIDSNASNIKRTGETVTILDKNGQPATFPESDSHGINILNYNIQYPPPRTNPLRAPLIGKVLKGKPIDVLVLQESFFQIYYETI